MKSIAHTPGNYSEKIKCFQAVVQKLMYIDPANGVKKFNWIHQGKLSIEVSCSTHIIIVSHSNMVWY